MIIASFQKIVSNMQPYHEINTEAKNADKVWLMNFKSKFWQWTYSPVLQREFQCSVNIQNSHVNFNVDKDNFFDTKSFVNDWVIKYESLLMDKNW